MLVGHRGKYVRIIDYFSGKPLFFFIQTKSKHHVYHVESSCVFAAVKDKKKNSTPNAAPGKLNYSVHLQRSCGNCAERGGGAIKKLRDVLTD